jgi:hypothetical protein
MHVSSHLSTKPLVPPLECHSQIHNVQQSQGTTAQAKFKSVQADNNIATTPLTEYSASIPFTLEIPPNLALENIIDINFLDQVLVKIDFHGKYGRLSRLPVGRMRSNNSCNVSISALRVCFTSNIPAYSLSE